MDTNHTWPTFRHFTKLKPNIAPGNIPIPSRRSLKRQRQEGTKTGSTNTSKYVDS